MPQGRRSVQQPFVSCRHFDLNMLIILHVRFKIASRKAAVYKDGGLFSGQSNMAAAAGNDPDPLVKVLNTVKETLVVRK